MIEDMDLPNPVIRSHYNHGFAKQYVRDNRLLRTEPATDVRDYGVNKDIENLPQLRQRMSAIIDNYHLVRFANIPAGSTLHHHRSIYPSAGGSRRTTPPVFAGGVSFDLSKRRAKGLLEKLPRSRRYRLVGKGYSVCLIFLKLFERIYAPLTAGLLKPFLGDHNSAETNVANLIISINASVDDLNSLLRAVGLKTAA